MTPEGSLKRDVVALLKVSGLLYFRMQSGKVKVNGGWMHLCEEGTADFLVFAPGACWIELKAKGAVTNKKRAEAQQRFRERVVGLGHKHLQADSLEAVANFISREQSNVSDGYGVIWRRGSFSDVVVDVGSEPQTLS